MLGLNWHRLEKLICRERVAAPRKNAFLHKCVNGYVYSISLVLELEYETRAVSDQRIIQNLSQQPFDTIYTADTFVSIDPKVLDLLFS